MKKYVSKDDVEKGLVDPKKPLQEQKQYMEKIQKQEHIKNPKHKAQHFKKKQRQNRPKYNWNRRDVTEDTVIPEAPKKQVPKPDKDKFFNQLNEYKKQSQQIYKKKSDIIQQMKTTMRNTNDSKKNTRTVKTKFSGILNQKNNTKKLLNDQLKLLDQKKEQIQKQFNTTKLKINSLRKPDSFQDYSLQTLQNTLEKTEQRLTTAALTKKQQNQINLRISQIKRALQKSRSDVQINAEINKLQDQNDITYKQLKQIKSIIYQKYNQLKQIKSQISQVYDELNSQKPEIDDNRTPQQIKKQYDIKLQAITQQKNKIKEKMDKLREAHDKSMDQYEDYFDLVSYIKMVKEEKQKIKQWKLQQERRKKQKQDEEKRRKQQFQQRQKAREEKKKKQQQRRKQVQERKQKLQKQRQDYINRNPHQDKIDMCKILIDYCDSLRPENAQKKLQKREQKVIQPLIDLNSKDSKDWEKQIKKGATTIVPKKLRDQQQAPKKVVKQKKKKQKQGGQNVVSVFTHHIDSAKMFQKINMLPPLTAAQIDETVKQLNQRIQLFGKPSEQQINVYKQKAGRQFDVQNGLQANQEKGGRRNNYREKGTSQNGHHEYQRKQDNDDQKDRTKNKKRFENKQIVSNQKQFPGLQ